MNHHQTAAEESRLEDLYRFQILDTEQEQQFNEIVELASSIANAPISVISLTDKKRQWFKARTGMTETELPRELSFCTHAIASSEPNFIVRDMTLDSRFAQNPLVTGEANIRFYAGFPLVTDRGNKLGTLCVVDNKPRQLNAKQAEALHKLSNQAMKLIELRLKNKQMEQLRAEEVKRNEDLERLLNNQRKIIAILAHDTRGPIHSMQQILSLFVQGLISDEEATSVYETMQEQCHMTLQMVEGLVKWGKIHLQAVNSQHSTEDLDTIVQDVFKQYELNAGLKSVSLHHQIDGQTTISASQEMLSFVVRNLVNNAIKYTEAGEVKVSGKRKGNVYELTVSDTGTGMSETTRKNLFNEQRSSLQGTRNEKGSGLGLMLIRDFVSQAGGTISVKTKLNAGTSVRIELPCMN